SLPWNNHVSDLKGWKNEVAALYGVKSIPANLLVDPEGNILAKNTGAVRIREILLELLAEKQQEVVISGRISPEGNLKFADSVSLYYRNSEYTTNVHAPIVNHAFSLR